MPTKLSEKRLDYHLYMGTKSHRPAAAMQAAFAGEVAITSPLGGGGLPAAERQDDARLARASHHIYRYGAGAVVRGQLHPAHDGHHRPAARDGGAAAAPRRRRGPERRQRFHGSALGLRFRPQASPHPSSQERGLAQLLDIDAGNHRVSGRGLLGLLADPARG